MNTATKRAGSGFKTALSLLLALSLCLSLLLPMGAFAADTSLKLTEVRYDSGVRFAFDCDSGTLYSLCQSGIGVTLNDEALTFNPNYSYHTYYNAAGEFIKESGDNALYFNTADFREGDNTVVITDPNGVSAAYNVTKTTTTETVEYWYGTETKNSYEFSFSEVTGTEPAQPSTEPAADPQPETPSDPVDGKILYVRLNGGFEHRIVGEEDIADATSAATGASYAVINEGNAVDVQAVLVPEGTAFADVAEDAWQSLQWLNGETIVQADGGKCKAVISPAGSGVTADYDTVYGQVKLSGTPAQAGDYTVTLQFTDTEGRTAVSNSVAFKIYSGDEKLCDQLVLENCSQTADGKYIYDMEPWYIHDFGGDQSVTVPADVKAWYGSHTRGTYGELGEIVSLTGGDAPVQELIIPAGCNLTMVNMRVHSGVKIIVEAGAVFSIRDTILEGIVEVRDGGTFSMDYNDYGAEAGFLFGSSINGQLQLLDGATISNARIVSHTNYSARDDQNRMNFAPVVTVTGNVNIVGDVYIVGDEAPNDGHGQPALSIQNGTLNVPAGSTLAAFGGGNSMLTPEGGDAITLDNGTITGEGKVIAVGGYCANITSNESYGHGGAAVSGTGTVSTAEAYFEGGSSLNTPAEPLKGDVTVSKNTRAKLVSGVQADTADTATYWKGTGDLDGTIPVLENYPVPEAADVTSGYVLMNVPYAAFFATQGVDGVDAVSTATLKTYNQTMAAGSYHDGYDAVEPLSDAKILGVTYPVYVEDLEDLAGLTKVTDESAATISVAAGKSGLTTKDVTGVDVLFASGDYAYYVLEDAPNLYLTATKTVDGFAFTGPEAEVESAAFDSVNIAYGGHHADVAITVADAANLTDYARLFGVVATVDGVEYALRHVENLWRKSETGWNWDGVDGTGLSGKTITNLKYYLFDGTSYRVLSYDVDLLVKQHGDAITASFADARTVTVTNLPADIQNPVAKVASKVGRGETPVVIAENVSVADGKITCADAAVSSTTYTVTVTSDNYADLAAEAVSPAAPEAPVASVKLNSSGNPVITWAAVEGAVRYQVFCAVGDGAYKRILTTANLKCTHSKNVANATTYSYKVCAIDANGYVSEDSSPVSVTTRPAAPAATVKLNASGNPVITWAAVEGAVRYQVYCAVGDGAYKRILTTTNLKCTHSKNVESGTTYSYKVCAVDANGSVSAYSSVVTVKTGLSAPEVSVKLNAKGNPVITWNAVEGAASYKVYCAVGDGAYKRILATPNLKCTHVKNVERGTTYSYKVCAVDADGVVGVYSTIVTVTNP